METHGKFSERGSSAKRPARSSKAKANLAEIKSGDGPNLEQALQELPDSRLEAVALARMLIADPDYPAEHLQKMAEHLAIQLTADIDTLPS